MHLMAGDLEGREQKQLIPPAVVASFAFIVCVACAFYAFYHPKLAEAGPYGQPVQEELREPLRLAAPDGYEITATDSYVIDALVISTQRYRFDASASLSPVDFLLAWGEVTLEPNLNAIRWGQSNRWMRWFIDDLSELSVPMEYVMRHVANVHIIPSFDDPTIKRELLRVRRGDSVRLTGFLVRVSGPRGFTWNSSRTRQDTGDGACEVFYVTSIEPIV